MQCSPTPYITPHIVLTPASSNIPYIELTYPPPTVLAPIEMLTYKGQVSAV